MKNLNQLFKIPVLKYDKTDIGNFENLQIDKLIEEIEEFKKERDYVKKCSEMFDIIQVCLSLIEIFNIDIIEMTSKNHFNKLNLRNNFEISGYYEIFKIINSRHIKL